MYVLLTYERARFSLNIFTTRRNVKKPCLLHFDRGNGKFVLLQTYGESALKRMFRAVLMLSLLSGALFNNAHAGENLKVGDVAPDFTLPFATKDSISATGFRLSGALGKNNIILAFYPADWSGGCTKEMCTMRDNFASLAGLASTVYGISGDYVYSHREWAKYHNLQFGLLSDHDHEVAKRYSSFKPESGFNLRTVYVIDRHGIIAYIDLAYKAGSPESFEQLRNALKKIK
jgi:glutaredoxin-dependent peroxiredoxin